MLNCTVRLRAEEKSSQRAGGGHLQSPCRVRRTGRKTGSPGLSRRRLYASKVIWNYLNKKTETVSVPQFVGQSYEMLQTDARYADYNFKVDWQTSNEYAAGTIIYQSFPEGRKIKKSQTITITVSLGPELATIPNITNLDLTTAKQALKSRGFLWEIEYIPDKEIASGHVITTNPVGEGQVAYGSTIQVYVSLGPEVIYVSYSDFSGYDLDTAKKKIEEAGLTVGEITYEDSSKPKNIVINQTPDPDANPSIAKGTAVDLVVSSGVISYDYKLSIKEVPNNFKDEYNNMSITLYVGGVEMYESAKFNANELDAPWTIDINSKTETATASVTITFYNEETKERIATLKNAIVYTIDMKKGTATYKLSNDLYDYISDIPDSSESGGSDQTNGGSTGVSD